MNRVVWTIWFVCARRERHALQDGHVFAAGEDDAISSISISSCSSCFLIESLNALGNGCVNNPSNIGFVDAHTEGNCGADELKFVVVPSALYVRSFPRRKLRVVVIALKSLCLHILSKFLAIGARETVDDARLSRVCVDEFDDLASHGFGFRSHLEEEIWTVE